MATFVAVAFIDPVHRGMVFSRGAWPLHITLTHFSSDLPPDRLAEILGQPARAALGAEILIGKDDMFGSRRTVPVSLVEHSDVLQRMHEDMVRALSENGADNTSPHFSGENYRPHVTVTDGRRVNRGDTFRINQVGLVEMRPDGDATIRRIPELWEDK
ncbi:2'-5' RNA ligase family protein [Arthrobacter monumenti]